MIPAGCVEITGQRDEIATFLKECPQEAADYKALEVDHETDFREDDEPVSVGGSHHAIAEAAFLIDMYEGCMKNTMICKSCTAEGPSDVTMYDTEGQFQIWCFDGPAIFTGTVSSPHSY